MVAPRLHTHCVLPNLHSPATGSARILIRLGLKPICCSFSACSVRTPPPLHGPSLRRGRRPLDYPDPFARAFDLAALRVPAAACAPLERRLRGHLLNWPRVRNVIRLPNDQGLLSLSPPPPRYPAEEPDGPTPRATAVARRQKLVRELDARGFLRFPNLARFSRPSRFARKRRERKGDGGDEEATREPEKDKAYVVEVARERGEDDDEWKGLVGEEGSGRDAWRIGSTRLLLLDERYAERKIDELPEAVKDVLDHETQHDGSSAYELIRCHLTLFYNYWSMNEVLEALLPEGVIIPTGFETIGHIAHLNLRDEHLPYKEHIASVVLDKNKPKIQTVVNKTDVIQNNYRTMQLEVLAGNGSLRTMVIENGLRFQVDIGTVYWNSRLATERQRLVNNIFRNLDVVCDMFSGVGPLAISAAKKVKYVYANDINPNAVEYLERNMVLNKLERKIEVFNMDARRFVSAVYSRQHVQPVTQIVMNLPNDAAEFLDVFKGILRNNKSELQYVMPMIHVYGFSKAEDPERDFHERINLALGEKIDTVEMYRVRLVAPGKWMICASFTLPESVAAAQPNDINC